MRPGKDLEAWRARRGLTVVEAAELFGISRGHYYKIVGGEHLPNVVTAAKIERETGIPAARWGDEN